MMKKGSGRIFTVKVNLFLLKCYLNFCFKFSQVQFLFIVVVAVTASSQVAGWFLPVPASFASSVAFKSSLLESALAPLKVKRGRGSPSTGGRAKNLPRDCYFGAGLGA